MNIFIDNGTDPIEDLEYFEKFLERKIKVLEGQLETARKDIQPIIDEGNPFAKEFFSIRDAITELLTKIYNANINLNIIRRSILDRK